VTIRSTNLATNGGTVATEVGSGRVSGESDELRQTQDSKIITMKLPGAVFGWKLEITYMTEDGPTSKFYEYSVHGLTYNSIIKTDNALLPHDLMR